MWEYIRSLSDYKDLKRAHYSRIADKPGNIKKNSLAKLINPAFTKGKLQHKNIIIPHILNVIIEKLANILSQTINHQTKWVYTQFE
jgi:hypothetical protein